MLYEYIVSIPPKSNKTAEKTEVEEKQERNFKKKYIKFYSF